MRLVDTHAHLMDEVFAADLPAVMERAVAAEVGAIVCVGYDIPTSQAAIALAERWPWVWATVGVHPNSVSAAPRGWPATLRELAAHPRVVAVGETGLDYYRDHTLPEHQQAAFQTQLTLAREVGLPAIVHCRDAEADVLLAIQEAARSASPGGVLHCFSGSEATMRAAVAAGYYISFAGPLTFKNAGALRAVAAAVPSERLLVETDAPYLSPIPVRGQRNEPAHVLHTATKLAEVRGETLAALSVQLAENARRLFGVAIEAAV